MLFAHHSEIVPLENGEIPISLLKSRPSENNYFNSTVLQEFIRATNIRLRFYRTKNLFGYLMSATKEDPSVTRRVSILVVRNSFIRLSLQLITFFLHFHQYFYSIEDILIRGRCMCNGHADTCNVLNSENSTPISACHCLHNTDGINCDKCRSGFEQKKWRQNTDAHQFYCERKLKE